eukprot:TRINITY_DN3360_c0_g1_i1.p1 TRINITY_DN3360_c0_g1~~TRINITY_DN3360_c0_g1_i1.p1  ORF type:complete len:151 (+),score=19.22 TRINITY_DN3360_c0_g1_i1:265-717(+)
MTQYVEDIFNPKVETTVGIGFAAKEIEAEGKIVKIQIWDTAGQESFRSITQNYYRNSLGALLVYDVTNKESFDQAKFWLEELHTNAPPNITIALVGNKVDLLANFSGGVCAEEASSFAKSHTLLFGQTSAKTADGVQKVTRQNLVFFYQV